MKMKLLITALTTLISLQGQAAVSKLICTSTKAFYGAKPEIVKVFPFKVTPGYLPSAEGEFDLSADTKITVSSNDISNEIQTVFFISTGQSSIQAGFRNKQHDQNSRVILNDDIISCEAVNQ